MRKMLFLLLFFTFSIYDISYANEPSISFSSEEYEFIKNHPVIRLGVDSAFVPFEFIDSDGQYKGIASDYVNLIAEKTGLKMEVIKGLTWTETYDNALKKKIDVLPAISKTLERERYFLFSEPYYYFKRVIVTKNTNNNIKGIEDLNGLTVAVQKSSSHHSYLLRYPQINLSLYDSVEAALTSVANGSEKAFVGNLATTNYLIRTVGLTNLKFISFEAEKQQSINFAVRKDWPELISILNKTLKTITDEEKFRINSKWIGVESEIDYTPFIRIILLISSLILVVFIVSAYWIIKLRNEIVKRKKIQEDLEITKKEAEEANSVKSSFLARMSHEIRTPLNAITGMAYLLKKTDISLTQKMYLERIIHASSNMLNIINDILDFSKIESGKVELEIISFNLDELLQDVVNIVSYKLEEQGVGFELSKDPKIPNWFYGDSKRIQQILINIINNATKFTQSGLISFDIGFTAQKNSIYSLVFTITDTGIGMSQDQIKQLFEPFSQADASVNRRFGGTGLGMSIVKNLVDMMNGEIKVSSLVGNGTTVVIKLTLSLDQKKEEEFSQQASYVCFNKIRTLVLEKTVAGMNLIHSYLESIRIYCELTTSENHAENLLESEPPFDLLIVDYNAPADKGFNFIQRMRNNKKIVKMPKIIILFPIMRHDLLDKLDEYDIDIGIVKPIIPSVLFNGILEIFKAKIFYADQIQNKISPAAKSINNHTILVVEDNSTNQLIAKSLLEQDGYTVLLAENGKDGVDSYIQHQGEIDLILMDLHMPVLNGYEAASKIREISEEIPIVAMTADVILGVTKQCETHGIHHYISKPFEPEHFIEAVSRIISESPLKKIIQDEILDRHEGLKYLGNNIQLYEMALNEYYIENKDTAEKLSLAIEEKRYEDAVQIVHKIKSSTGSIGSPLLYSVARDLQKEIEHKNEKQINHLLDEFNKLLKKLLLAIKN